MRSRPVLINTLPLTNAALPTLVAGSDRAPTLGDSIRADWVANRSNRKSRLILLAFRLLHPVATHRSRVIRRLGLPLLLLYQFIAEWLLCVELPLKTAVGAGLRIAHGYALVINDGARIGAGCTLRHCTTIGVKVSRDGQAGRAPALGSHVDVGAKAVILGAITIGDHAIIGAGSVVLHDVPAHATVAGNPARVLS